MTESLPDEINFHIMLQKNYDELMAQATISRKFNNLLTSDIFWRAKSVADFAISNNRYNEIWRHLINHNHNLTVPIVNLARETYIAISADNGIYVPRAEFYGHLDTLTSYTIGKDNFNHFKYLLSHYGIPGNKTKYAALRTGTFKYMDELIKVGHHLNVWDVLKIISYSNDPDFIDNVQAEYEQLYPHNTYRMNKIKYWKYGAYRQVDKVMTTEAAQYIDEMMNGALQHANWANIHYIAATNPENSVYQIQFAALSGNSAVIDYTWKLSTMPELEKYQLTIKGLITDGKNFTLFNDLLNKYIMKYGPLSEDFWCSIVILALDNTNDVRYIINILANGTVWITPDIINSIVMEVYHTRTISNVAIGNLVTFMDLATRYGVTINTEIIEMVLFYVLNWSGLDKSFIAYLQTHPANPQVYFGIYRTSTYSITDENTPGSLTRLSDDVDKVTNSESMNIFVSLYNYMEFSGKYMDIILIQAAKCDNLLIFKYFLQRGANLALAVEHIHTPQIIHYMNLHHPGLLQN